MSDMDAQQRLTRLELAISDFPAHVAQAQQRLSAVLGDEVTGRDPGSQVSVTATAAGAVTSVRVDDDSLRHLDDHRLAEAVRLAANQALAKAEQVLQNAVGGPGDDEVDSRLAAFESRMDDLLGELERAERALDRLEE